MKQMRSLKQQGGWLQYAAAGVAVAGGLTGYSKANKAAKANAALIRMETKETLRRMELSQQQLVGEANVRASASGFTKDGSIDTYFENLETEYQNQVDWTKRAGAQRAKVARAGGSAAASGALYTGISAGITGFGMAAGWYNN